MRKKVFHKNLYKDQLKQLRLIGFIGLGLLSLIAILLPIGKAISISRYSDYEVGGYIQRANVEILDSHFYLFFVFTLLVPILALTCFHYLTQRNSSDFYHSLPHTRTCVFTCNIAAIYTWITALVWIPTIISIIMHSILSHYFILEIPLLLRFAFFIYLASLLVTAAISIACSITGSVITNVVVSGIIIFLPRICILVFTSMISGSSIVLLRDHLFPLLDYKYNVILGTLISILGQGESMGWGTILYSIVLILIYLALGLLVYRRRKSESANQPAVSRNVQTGIRLLLGTTVSLLPISIIFEIMTGSQILDPIQIYTLCILYLVACIVMLLYELLTTKKFKNVIKALPSIGILAIINVIILLGAFGICKGLLSYHPDAEDIDYIVTLQRTNNDDTAYYDTLATSTHIEDEKAIQIISDYLKSNLNDETIGSYWNDEIQSVKVGIHSGLTTHYRRLWIPKADYDELMKSYARSEEYKEAYTSLPSLTGNKLGLAHMNMSDNDYLELYNVAKEEIKSLAFEEWLSILNMDSFGAIDTLNFYAPVENESLRGIVPITEKLPNTTKKYFELAVKYQKKNQAAIITALKAIQSQNSEDYGNAYFNICILDMANSVGTEYGVDSFSFTEDNMDKQTLAMNTLLCESMISATRDYTTFHPATDYILRVDYYNYTNPTSSDENGSYLFIIEKSKLQKFAEYIGLLPLSEEFNTDETQLVE